MISPIKRTAITVILAITTGVAQARTPVINWQTQGFEQPESIVFNAKNKQFYVSNISGTPMQANGEGFISRLSKGGKIIEKYWVTGMNAPKGLAQKGNWLFVADLKQLHIIDINKSKLIKSITAKNSKMLNDITVDKQGNVYISDLIAGGIYRLEDNNLVQWISPKQLPHPNGLFANGKTLIVATWGEGMHDDFSTDVLGGLLSVNLTTKAITPLPNAQAFGNLDGVVKIDDTFIVNDWINGNVFTYKNGQLNKWFVVDKSTADIGSDGKNVIAPVMMKGTVVSYALDKNK